MQNSCQSLSWVIPKDAPGGSYSARIEYTAHGLSSGERKFEVRAFQNPRLTGQIEFVKKAYGAGDVATFTLNVKRAEGGFPEKAIVKCTARIDGNEAWKGETTIDKNGNCLMQFQLPKEIVTGDGTLSCVVHDGGVIETINKTIPIVKEDSLSIDIYPEGGDLVQNLECGFYIEATNKSGDPADVTADLIDYNGNVITQITTKHEGRGKAFFTPKDCVSGQNYHLKVIKPTGISKKFVMPSDVPSGVALTSKKDVFQCLEMIHLKLQASKAGSYVATIFKRESELAAVKVTISQDLGNSDVYFTLPTDGKADGVLRVLIKDENKKPLAERLIFRKPEQKVKFVITPDYKAYCPGDKATIRMFASDLEGNAVDATVLVSVTDETVLESVEKRKQAPRLPEMVYLEHEVDHLEDAKVYLSSSPKAEVALDLLLGTQGWRRFVFEAPQDLMSKETLKAERLFCVHFGTKVPTKPLIQPVSTNPIRKKKSISKDEKSSDFGSVLKSIVRSKESLPLDDSEDDEEERDHVQLNKISELEATIIPIQKIESRITPPPQAAPIFDSPPPPPVWKQQPVQQTEIVAIPLSGPSPQSESQRLLSPSISRGKSSESMKKGMISSRYPTRVLPKVIPSYVRSYAHKKRDNRQQNDRLDFTETLCWEISKVSEGRTQVSFDLSDSVTSFRIMVDIFTPDGVVASFDRLIESKEPFYMEPKIPLEVSAGDVIHVPVSLVNSSSESLEVKITPQVTNGITLVPNKKGTVTVDTNSRERQIYEFKVDQFNGTSDFKFVGSAGPFSDTVSRKCKVVPLGFPSTINHSASLDENATHQCKFEIPAKIAPNSLNTKFSLITSTLSSISRSLDALITEPHGCFEQTSSTNYPLVLGYHYMIMKGDVNTGTLSKSKSMIEKAYKTLIGYECKKGGFDWFGSGDGLETLTAYGLMEFIDMKSIVSVDQAMLDRTMVWLMSKRDGKGLWNLNDSKSYQMSHGYVKKEVSYAYILYALTESQIVGLETELKWLANGIEKQDAYVQALAANAFFNANMKEASDLNAILAKKLGTKNFIEDTSATSITRSTGEYLSIEISALACLSWLKEGTKYINELQRVVKWLHSKSSWGRYGNTQGTILALKALIAFEKYAPKRKSGSVDLVVNKDVYSIPVPHDANQAIDAPDFVKSIIVGGVNQVQVVSHDVIVPFTLNVNYNAIVPASDQDCLIGLQTKLSDSEFMEGMGGEIDVIVKNRSDLNQDMTMAIIGLPGGVEPRHDQLKELVKQEVMAFYEIVGRNVICYFRYIEAKAEIKFKIDIVARVPGKYVAPPSRAYLYYKDQAKCWVDGVSCEITPGNE